MMAERKANRVAQVLATALAVVVLGGIAVLGVRLRPYWVARYRGEEADLRGATLIRAPLGGANLNSADLHGADLRGACLTRADLCGANLGAADLSYANLAGALLTCADLRGADLRGADLRGADLGDLLVQRADLRGIRCDRATRWPAGFNPDGWRPG
jgi:pentapeptide repeat protein